MRIPLKATTFVALLLAGVSAEQSGIFAANGVELEMYQFGEDVIYGEPVSYSFFLSHQENADPL